MLCGQRLKITSEAITVNGVNLAEGCGIPPELKTISQGNIILNVLMTLRKEQLKSLGY